MKKTFSLKILLFVCCVTTLVHCKKDDAPFNNNSNASENNKSIGESAMDLLSGQKFDELLIEIQYMPDMRPTSGAVDNLFDFLSNRLNKENIRVTYKEIVSGGKNAYTIDDVRSIEEANRESFNSGGEIATYFLFLDAEYSTPNVLGIAYRNTSMALFESTLKENSGGLFRPSLTTLETTVLEHEFGHILGLVNNGSPLQSDHQDEEHGKHCDVEDCLMYYAVETTDFVSNLSGGNIPNLDAQCLADLKANGGK